MGCLAVLATIPIYIFYSSTQNATGMLHQGWELKSNNEGTGSLFETLLSLLQSTDELCDLSVPQINLEIALRLLL